MIRAISKSFPLFFTRDRISISSNEEIDVLYYILDDKIRLKSEFVNTKPPYQTKIKRSFLLKRHIKGIRTLKVVATTTSGKTAQDEMDICLLSII